MQNLPQNLHRVQPLIQMVNLWMQRQTGVELVLRIQYIYSSPGDYEFCCCDSE